MPVSAPSVGVEMTYVTSIWLVGNPVLLYEPDVY